MNRIAQILVMAALTAAGAQAQSLNVDIDRTTGTGIGTPTLAYTGASGQIGHWNSMLTTAVGPVNMLALNGTNSGVTCTKQTGGGSSSSVAGATSDYSKLMFDYMSTTGMGSKVGVTLNGLDQGLYRVYVYAALPGSAGSWVDSWGFTNYYSSLVVVKVGGSQAFSSFCGGDEVVANTFTKGNNFVVGNILVGAGAPAVDIESHTGFTNNERAALNGFQLVKFTGDTVYVNYAATGANTGQSWFNAFTNLQDALQLARDSGGQIKQIWVAKGTYYPTGSPASNVRTASFALVNGVKVLGGFEGSESLLSQRDPVGNPTWLSGNLGSRFATNDNSYHVVTASGTDATAVLDGFTVANGTADQVNDPIHGSGGGLYMNNGGPTIRNVKFTYNSSLRYGGAVFVTGDRAPLFDSCEFTHNTSSWSGAGIYFAGSNVFFAPVLKVNGCTFINNTASSGGGSGIKVDVGGAWIANSLFNGNHAGEGGAIAAYNQFDSSSASVYNCTIVNNSAFVQSGGLYTAFTSSLFARNCIVWNNTSGNAWRGAQFEQAYAQPGSTLTITHSDVKSENLLGFPGVGNINQNPMFALPAGANGIAGDFDDDFSLTAASPVIDAGNNTYVTIDFTDTDQDGNFNEKVPFDLAGNARQVDDAATADSGVGAAPIVDMGCFEFVAPPVPECPADFNQDGGIDGSDVDAFFTAWQAGEQAADVNLDGGVNGEDVEFFFAAWENGGC